MRITGPEAALHEDTPAAGATAAAPASAWDANVLVKLDPDHPGFRDPAYRARRDAIARLALEYREGDPAPVVAYTDDEHEVWRTVWAHLDELHGRYACRAYREGSAVLRLDRGQVPQLAALNPVLEAATGYRMLPVAGLVGDRTFLSHLGRDVFLSTQYLRHPSRPLYTPEPDVIHELVGHGPTFCHEGFARMNRSFGAAAARVGADDLARVARTYWYTMEFGVVEEDGALKVCGAGLLSSFGELGRFESAAALRPLDLTVVGETPYDPTSYQDTLFVAPGFDAMATQVCAWLDSLGG